MCFGTRGKIPSKEFWGAPSTPFGGLLKPGARGKLPPLPHPLGDPAFTHYVTSVTLIYNFGGVLSFVEAFYRR